MIGFSYSFALLVFLLIFFFFFSHIYIKGLEGLVLKKVQDLASNFFFG